MGRFFSLRRLASRSSFAQLVHILTPPRSTTVFQILSIATRPRYPPPRNSTMPNSSWQKKAWRRLRKKTMRSTKSSRVWATNNSWKPCFRRKSASMSGRARLGRRTTRAGCSGLKLIAVGAIIAGSVLSGGTLAPILIGAGTAYLVADSGYQAVSGETISGKRLTDGERIWAGVDAVLTAATGGFATYASVLAKTGKAATTTVQTVGKAVNYADDANDIAHTVTAMQDDPWAQHSNLE